jgi:hypothetical protein
MCSLLCDRVRVGVRALPYLPRGVFPIECVLYYVIGIECVLYYVIVGVTGSCLPAEEEKEIFGTEPVAGHDQHSYLLDVQVNNGICVCACVCVCVRVCACVCVYSHTHTHTHTHKYIHTYINNSTARTDII